MVDDWELLVRLQMVWDNLSCLGTEALARSAAWRVTCEVVRQHTRIGRLILVAGLRRQSIPNVRQKRAAYGTRH